jgi:DNA-binding transcriptional LysR family regulator
MRVFVTVAEEQSFSAGARRLGLSPPAVTRAVAALEERIGVRLLNRTTRMVRPTEAGSRYLLDARRLIAEIEEAEDAAAGVNAAPRGHLTVTAPVLFGRMYVIPGIVEFLERYPDTQVSALFLDRVVSLLEEGVDAGVRIGELPDSELRARRVGTVRLVLCAAPGYLRRHGLPRQPADLADHTLIAASAVSAVAEWHLGQATAVTTVRAKPRLTVTGNDAAIAAAVRGFGITRLLSYQVAPQLADGSLQLLLADHEPAPLPIHVVHREGRHGSTKVRAFLDLMTIRLRADPTLNGEPTLPAATS